MDGGNHCQLSGTQIHDTKRTSRAMCKSEQWVLMGRLGRRSSCSRDVIRSRDPGTSGQQRALRKGLNAKPGNPNQGGSDSLCVTGVMADAMVGGAANQGWHCMTNGKSDDRTPSNGRGE